MGARTQAVQRVSEKPAVLVVDDEESIRTVLSEVLIDEGWHVETSASGEEALVRISEQAFPVVFLDIWMPGLDGLKTLDLIQGHAPHTRVIMISGHATIGNALEATRRGAFDFIEKPLDIDSVIQAARRASESLPTEVSEVEPFDTLSDADKVKVAPLFRHPSIASRGRAGRNFGQRTLKQSAILYGQGLHSGKKSGLVLEPLPLDSGIHFGNIGNAFTVPAFVDYVHSTSFATTIRGQNVAASTTEHLLAALSANRISNLLIKCNGEVPILDGSAEEFCEQIARAGIEEQGGEWFELVIDEPLRIGSEDAQGESISLEPADEFSVSYRLCYPNPVGTQEFTFCFTSVEDFRREIAPARTFGFLRDIEKLQRAGLAAGGRLDNFILIGEENVINTELRFPDELVRHKILDIFGDLFLLGRPLRAHVTAVMTGHEDNVSLLRKLSSLLS